MLVDSEEATFPTAAEFVVDTWQLTIITWFAVRFKNVLMHPINLVTI